MKTSAIGTEERTTLKALEHIIQNRYGYKSELSNFGQVINSFEQTGFIKTGYTLSAETYGITKLGDSYGKIVLGRKKYNINRIKGFIKRLFK